MRLALVFLVGEGDVYVQLWSRDRLTYSESNAFLERLNDDVEISLVRHARQNVPYQGAKPDRVR
jgi:hypothetical protein